MKPLTILVSGCGGDISQSIGKILRSYKYSARVLGCDIHAEHAGQFIFDKCFEVEKATSPLYVESMVKLLKQEHVDVFIPVTEFELQYFLNTGSEFGGIVMVRPDNNSLTIGLDKLNTARFLELHKLPFPTTKLVSQVTDPELPCIIKHRRGSGSKVLHLVKDKSTFSLLSALLPDAICQRYIDSDDMEFTCALFRNGRHEIRQLTFKRKLSGGYSSYGVVEQLPAIDDLLTGIANLLELRGSINIQLRMKDNVPMIFEINARFSSTVLVRHLLGFQDLIWSIEDRLGWPMTNYKPPSLGSKFYKGFQEYIVKAN